LLVAACAKHEAASEAEAQFAHAKELLAAGDYARATLAFERFLAKHPLHPKALEAEELRIFAAFRDHEYILVETLAERFLARHPRHPHADYVRYMLGRALEKQVKGAKRDIEPAKKALAAYRELLRRHPNSLYAADARARAQRMLNLIAEHELAIARFYFERKRNLAAANRCMEIVARYQTTPAIEEALYLLALAQARLGLLEDARQTKLLLEHNYPKSRWTQRLSEALR